MLSSEEEFLVSAGIKLEKGIIISFSVYFNASSGVEGNSLGVSDESCEGKSEFHLFSLVPLKILIINNFIEIWLIRYKKTSSKIN